jgi:YVTN family beta-propeller protein
MRPVSPFAFAVVLSLMAGCSDGTGPGVPAGIVISPAAPWIKLGTSVQLTATVVDSAGRPVLGQSVWFESTDNSVITVTRDGLASAVGPLGRVLVIARSVAPGNAMPVDTLTGVILVGAFDTSIVARFSLDARPYSVAVSVTDVAYVSEIATNQLARVDLSTLKVVDSVAVGIVPTEIAFNSTGSKAYVTNQFSQTVSVIDGAVAKVISGFSVRGNPFAVIVAPGDTIVYVTTAADSLFGVRAATGEIKARLQVPIISNGFAVHDSLLYVSTRDVGTVRVINLKTNQLLDTISLGGGPQGILVSPDGRELYVANENATLQFWNIAGDSLDAALPLAGGGFGLARQPVTGRLYVGTLGGGEVQVVDPATRTIVKAFPTGGVVRRIAFNAAGTLAVVANEAGWVDFIR